MNAQTLVIPVDDQSRVAQVRRLATGLAQEEGLDSATINNLGIVVTELCTNLIKHAKRGEIFLNSLSARGHSGVEILSVDSGPGMPNVSQCLADGYSSANTAGNGLGAIARLSTEFDIHSQCGKGTVLVSRFLRPRSSPTSVGSVLKPVANEEECGDAWSIRQTEDGLIILVSDGLGHGPAAAFASAQAVAAFQASADLLPLAVLRQVHLALHGTRGAAVAAARVDNRDRLVRFAGLGNISGVLLGSGKASQMVSHNGTAGFEFPRLQEFTYPFKDETLLIMHSDGLQSLWSLDLYPGLRRRDPSLIAAVLYRDFSRQRDDVCVVVARIGVPG